MSDTTFVSKVTQIATAWMQDLNNFFYRFTGGTPKATPVPGDGFWLWDSVGSAWKTLSFTNLLTYLTGSLTPTNAVNATNATNAVNSTNATNATNAVNATNATNVIGSGTVSSTTTGGAGLTPTTAANALLGGFYGATWQTTSYASGTQYTSPVGHAMYCKFILATTASQGYFKYTLVIGGVTVVNNYQFLSAANNSNYLTVDFIVPANTTWTFTNAANQTISAQSALQ